MRSKCFLCKRGPLGIKTFWLLTLASPANGFMPLCRCLLQWQGPSFDSALPNILVAIFHLKCPTLAFYFFLITFFVSLCFLRLSFITSEDCHSLISTCIHSFVHSFAHSFLYHLHFALTSQKLRLQRQQHLQIYSFIAFCQGEAAHLHSFSFPTMPLVRLALQPREEVPQENLPSCQVSPPYNRPTGSNRRPLQPLSISFTGSILNRRESVLRPFPSPDKENCDATVQAISHRVAHQTREIKRLSLLHSLLCSTQQKKRRRKHLRQRSGILQSNIANMGPATRRSANHRLSLQFDSDGSGDGAGTGSDSEPDLSHLGMTRRGMTAVLEQQADQMAYDDEDDAMSQGQYDDEDASLGENEDIDENAADNCDDQVEEVQEEEPLPIIDPAVFGLKEISNLGKFTVSSHKPGNGVEQLRSDELTSYWQ
jgi:hypothetical protein